MASTEFKYEPLEDSTSSLRVVQVVKRAHGTIYVRMRQVQTPTSYRCLSYVWGDKNQEVVIFVNNQQVRVRQNLYDFLQSAPLSCVDQPIWIDALCINQGDHTEKNHQVQRMGDIYRGAEIVLIWPGKHMALNPFVSQSFLLHQDVLDRPECDEPHIQCATSGIPGIWKALRSLCYNSYWRRTWIVQEMLLARDLLIILPGGTLNWNSLKSLICKNSEPRFSGTRYMEVWNFIAYRDSAGGAARNNSTLKRVLSLMAGSECYDRRDRIYAILSLLEKGEGFLVDYSEEVYSLFWRAAVYFEILDNRLTMRHLRQSLGLEPSTLRYTLRNVLPSKALKHSIAIKCTRNPLAPLVRLQIGLVTYRCLFQGWGACTTHDHLVEYYSWNGLLFCVVRDIESISQSAIAVARVQLGFGDYTVNYFCKDSHLDFDRSELTGPVFSPQYALQNMEWTRFSSNPNIGKTILDAVCLAEKQQVSKRPTARLLSWFRRYNAYKDSLSPQQKNHSYHRRICITKR